MPSDRTLLSLNASLAIPTRVLRLEASGTLARQACPVFGFGFVAQQSNPMIFW
jgi:hypothetical protein